MERLAQVRAVWFDLFRTIVRPPTPDAVTALLSNLGVRVDGPGGRAAIAGVALGPLFADAGVDVVVARRVCLTRALPDVRSVGEMMVALGGVSPTEEQLGTADALTRLVADATSLVPGALMVLKTLRAKGIATAIVTNADAIELQVVTRLGLDRMVDAVVASCEVGELKPSRAVFFAAASRLGVPAGNTIAVGDDWRADVLGALSVGSSVVWIDRGQDPVAALLASRTPEAVLRAASPGPSRDELALALAPWLPTMDHAISGWQARIRRVTGWEYVIDALADLSTVPRDAC